MVFLLNNQNAFQYLIDQKIIESKRQNNGQIESKSCKNFNLLVRFPNDNNFLIKQEPHDQNGNTNRDFLHEWQVYQLLQNYPELSHIQSLLPEAIYFDSKHSILIFNYLTNYCDLEDFYTQNHAYQDHRLPISIAAALGKTIAEIHRTTFDRQDYKAFLTVKDGNEDADDEAADDEATETVPDLADGLEALTPEIFGMVCADGLKFYELYQRYESLSQAIRELNADYTPCCLIHNDLKLSNVLLHLQWDTLLASGDRFCPSSLLLSKTGKDYPTRLIDWEKWMWGDPAADLGTVVASYLKIWLKSLTVRSGIPLDVALSLAQSPLETIQPSIVALTQAYLMHFREILEQFPNFLQRVMQFTGLALIESILAKLHYHEPFGNIEICMLQVAKTLLCSPLQSVPTVFGIPVSDLLNLDHLPKICQGQTSEIPRQTIPRQTIPQQTISQQTTLRQTHRITQPKPDSSSRFELTPDVMLQDLVNHVQIRSNFCIDHLHHAPLHHAEELAAQLGQLPVEIQRSYMRAQLRNYLYDIYFSGEYDGSEGVLAQTAEIDVNSNNSTILENNTVRGLNVQFYEQLHQSNCGEGYFDSGWRVLRQEQNGTFAVQKDGLTIYIEPRQHLQNTEAQPAIGDIVAIRLPRHRLEAGFYVAVGNAGFIADNSPAIEIYFNVTPAGAMILMQRLTQHLNAIGIPFLFKAIADFAEYGRYDSAILQVERRCYRQVRQVLQSLYGELAAGQIDRRVPLFTKEIASGIGIAEDPETELDVTDFGLNRCQIVADALLSVWETEDNSPETRLRAIWQQFTQQGIDWQRPYLNANSEDIYTPLFVP